VLQPDRVDREAADAALRRSTARLERASAAVERHRRSWSSRTRADVLREWERAWDDYLTALVVALALCPRRLAPWQRELAAIARRRRLIAVGS
jgi:hypothetical protein